MKKRKKSVKSVKSVVNNSSLFICNDIYIGENPAGCVVKSSYAFPRKLAIANSTPSAMPKSAANKT